MAAASKKVFESYVKGSMSPYVLGYIYAALRERGFDLEDIIEDKEKVEAYGFEDVYVVDDLRSSIEKVKEYLLNSDTMRSLSHFVFEYDSYNEWGVKKRPSRCLVELLDHDIKFTKLKGSDPTVAQVGTIVEYVASKTASLHRYNRCNRVHPYRTSVRTGYSGCRDITLDLYRRRGDRYLFMHRAASLHISMYDKIGDFQMYIGDLLEILLAVSVTEPSEHDFGYNTSKKYLKKYGIRLSNLYSNEVLEEDELTFIPKEKSLRRSSRRK